MSGSLQLYALLFVGVEGTLLVEEQSVDISRASKSVAVDTVAKGYAGESVGAAMIDVDVKNAVPEAGFEFDMGAKIQGLIPIAFQVRGPGGKTTFGRGFVYMDTVTHSKSADTSYNFKLRAPLSLFV